MTTINAPRNSGGVAAIPRPSATRLSPKWIVLALLLALVTAAVVIARDLAPHAEQLALRPSLAAVEALR